jgi:predicted RNase H-related nuclease YkuK (DUF458 family)
MERVFKTLSTKRRVDLSEYVKEYVSLNKNVEILIGCDSQNHGIRTVFAIVVGLYRPGKGAHVLYCRYETPRERDNVSRLLKEVWESVEVAEIIRTQVGVRATFIDIDLNPDPKYKSNQALSSAVGLVTGMGYKVRHKGDSPIMTYCADHLVK